MSSDAAAPPDSRPPSDSPPLPAAASAVRNPWSWLRFGLVGALGLTLDLWSKHWAFENLEWGGRTVIVPKVLEFQVMLNSGALFGIGAGQTTLFLIASLFALVLVLWMFAQSTARNRLLHVALGGILAGALGNMYDRVNVQLAVDPQTNVYVRYLGERDGRHEFEAFPPTLPPYRVTYDELPPVAGHVRDFIKIPTKLWGDRDLWPWVFNIADMLLVGGVSILAVFLWRDRSPDEGAKRKRGPAAGDEAPASAETGAPGTDRASPTTES